MNLLLKWILRISASVLMLAMLVTRAYASDVVYMSYEQRLAYAYMLAMSGQSDAVKTELAGRLFQRVDQIFQAGEKVIEVTSFDEFLLKSKGAWPETGSVLKDLEIIERTQAEGYNRFESKDPQVQQRISDYLEAQKEYLKKMNANGNPVQMDSVQLFAMVGKARIQGEEKNKKDFVEHFNQKIEPEIQKQLSQMENIGEKISQSGQMNFKDEGMKVLIETLVGEYYKRMSSSSKKNILLGLSGENLKSSDMDKFQVMVLNSGPQYQKLFQILIRDGGLSPELLEVFKRLESDVRAVPPVLVKELIEAEKTNYRWKSYELKPLGVGTMAQVHKAVLKKEGRGGKEQMVVVRFLKPGIEDKVLEDKRILSEIAPIVDANPAYKKSGMPKLTDLVSEISRTVEAELSLEDTINRQKDGRKAYQRNYVMDFQKHKIPLHINVPGIIESKNGKSNLMVQELVIGDKLDKVYGVYNQEIPDLKKRLVEEVALMWMDQILFREGFYHSDLHQGNFLVDLTDPKITLSVLDFGMGGTLSRQTQQKIIMLGFALELMNAKLIADMYWNMGDPAQHKISREDFNRKVESKVRRMYYGKTKELGVEGWTSWALDLGLHFPYEFINLNRGMAILNKSLKEADSEMTMKDIAKKASKKHLRELFDLIRADGRIQIKELLKFGWFDMIGLDMVEGFQWTKNLGEKFHDKINLFEKSPQAPVQKPLGSSLRCENVLLGARAL